MVAKLNNEPISPVVKLTQRALDKQKNLFTIPFFGKCDNEKFSAFIPS